MNGKFPLTGIGILEPDTRKWYEAEQCRNCEPEDLRKMQIRNNRSAKRLRTKRR